MEYSLLKKSDVFMTMDQNDLFLNTSYPSQDFINPGCGNIIKPFCIYVPIYAHQNVYQQQKVNSNQLGFGSGNGAAGAPASSSSAEHQAATLKAFQTYQQLMGQEAAQQQLDDIVLSVSGSGAAKSDIPSASSSAKAPQQDQQLLSMDFNEKDIPKEIIPSIERKRKLLDPAIFQQLMHPTITTSKLASSSSSSLNKEDKPSAPKKSRAASSSSIKKTNKFRFH